MLNGFDLDEVGIAGGAVGDAAGHDDLVAFAELERLLGDTLRMVEQDVELTATEFRLIEDLLRNAGRVRTREELLAAVWGYQFEGYARTVDTHIRRLRNKLGDAAEIIETVRGVGYRCKE